jgi:restriction endonuclease S subunit
MKYKTYKIKDLINEISMGPFGSNIKVECFVDSGIPVLNGSNLTGFALNDNSFRYVTPEKADSLGKANAYRGDIVITHRGTLGQIVFIPENSKHSRYVISQSQFRVKCNEKILPEYLVYYFHTNAGQHKLLSNASQVGVPALARASTTFQTLEIDIPDVTEQRKIVDLLETIREKIELNNAINNNLEQQAMALFKSRFIDFEPFDGKVPKAWINGVLGDFVEIKRGGSPRPIQKFLSDSGFHWLKISDATGISSPFINEIKEYINEAGLKKTVYLKSGSLVLSNSATPGLPKILDIDTCIHDGWLYFPSSKFSNEYLYLYFKYIRDNLIALGNGSVFTNLKTDILKNYPTYLPTEDVLKKFDGLVQPIFSMILSKTREIKRLAEIRDTLLPKLMSGELDVSGIDL